MASKGAGLALNKANQTRFAREEAMKELKYYGLEEGSTIYALRRGGSASGLTHYYSLFMLAKNALGEPTLHNVTYYAGKVLDENLVDKDGHRVIKVQGGGMDMGFYLVYSLSSILFAGQDRAGYVLGYERL